MPLFAVTIFTSAFLLFLVQPIVAKQVLPWFGGSAAVWATCLVFFQTALLLGYAYADLVIRRIAPRTQLRVHLVLLVASLVSLPIVPAVSWKPTGAEQPVFLILGMLAFTIGLPYFLLSTTSPLLQAWFARRFPGRNPYRLFALSNLASLLALLGYPFLLEPWVPTRMQAFGWSAGYAVFVVLAAAAAWSGRTGAAIAVAPAQAETDEPPPTAARQVLWGTLAATGSVMLLAVSNHITQNVASVPLLWVVPLSIYLVTFILCFDGHGWYRRYLFLAVTSALLGAMAWSIADPDVTHDLTIQLSVFAAGLFVACMFCHGELARLKPAPAYLTRFYLMVSVGGAVGSALVGIVAPLVLPADFELNGVLVLCALLLLWQARQEPKVYPMLATLAIVSTLGCAVWGVVNFYDTTIVAKRNFYGVLRVQETGDEVNGKRRQLIHGNIMHGKQYLRDDLKREATSYYSAHSGIGRVIEALHPRKDPLKVGVIGLGTGTIAVYGAKGDTYRFYDINPGVVEIAKRDFSYLADSDATIEIPLGDARLTLERELRETGPQNFDVLAIDAFSSDAIPVHLITREAVEVYLKHMKPDGVIAFHVTNRYLDLVPVVEGIAHELDLHTLWISDDGDLPLANSSSWVLVAKDPVRLSDPKLMEAATNISARRDWRVWTDDFNNLLQVMK